MLSLRLSLSKLLSLSLLFDLFPDTDQALHQAGKSQVPDRLCSKQWLLHGARLRQGRLCPQGGATTGLDFW